MKYIKLIFLLSILSSCSSKKQIVGLYGKCSNNYLGCTQIEIKPDKTFEYFIFMNVGGGTVVKGNWEKISDNTLKMNTFDQPKKPSTTYTGKINPNRTNIQITIADIELPLPAAFVVINNNDKGTAANQNGIVELKSQKINSITYYYLGQKETIQISNPDYNEIEITVKDLDLNAVPRYLTNKIIRVINGKLFFNASYFLKKTQLKNKQWN